MNAAPDVCPSQDSRPKKSPARTVFQHGELRSYVLLRRETHDVNIPRGIQSKGGRFGIRKLGRIKQRGPYQSARGVVLAQQDARALSQMIGPRRDDEFTIGQ